jgi:hypothetical protein
VVAAVVPDAPEVTERWSGLRPPYGLQIPDDRTTRPWLNVNLAEWRVLRDAAGAHDALG